MKFTSWNIRGLGSKRKKRMLVNRMKQAVPDIIFVQETKCSIQKLRQIHSKWLSRFEFLEVKAENTAGGTLTLWNPQKLGIIDAEASRNYLSMVIQPIRDINTYLVTNVYGPQRLDDKIRFIDSLVDLRVRYAGLPRVIGGDFNMIRSLLKKKGDSEILNVPVAQILKHIKLKLKASNKNEFGNIFAGKKAVEDKIMELNQALIKEGFDKSKNNQVEKYHQEWENLCKQEEIFWKQKSRVQWLKEGERNTKFFHRFTIANRTHNRISLIKDKDG
eukprot:PITA_09399